MINIPYEVKELLHNGADKEFFVHFPNHDMEDFGNDNIVNESVTFTESLCSQDELKFGLCESSVIEFKTIGIGNIKGKTVQCSCLIDTSSLGANWNAQHNVESGKTLLELTQSKQSGTISFTKEYSTLKFSCETQSTITPWITFTFTCKDMVEYERVIEVDGYSGVVDVPNNAYKVEVYPDGSTLGVEYSVTISEPDIVRTKYPVPYGTFIVDSCKRDSKNIQIRNVECYSVDNSIFNSPANITSAKFQVENGSSAALKFDIYKEIYANIINDGRFDDSTGTTLGTKSMGEVTNTVNGATVTTKYVQYSFGYTKADAILRLKLPLLNFQFFNWLSTPVEEVIETYCPHFRQVEVRMPSGASGTYVSGYVDTKKTTVFYPYAYTSLQVNYMVRVPYEVTVYIDGSGVFQGVANYDTDNTVFETLNTSSLTTMYIQFPRSIKSGPYYIADINEFDMRSAIEGLFELQGIICKTDRDGNIKEFHLSWYNGLYPSGALLPNTGLYPRSDRVGSFIMTKGMYSQAWYDDFETRPYGRIEVPYTNASGVQSTAYKYIGEITKDEFDMANYRTYSLSDNYILQNCKFAEETILSYLTTLADSLEFIKYYPAEIDCFGMPWVESGDWVTVMLPDAESFETVILRRTLSGIKALKDTYESN